MIWNSFNYIGISAAEASSALVNFVTESETGITKLIQITLFVLHFILQNFADLLHSQTAILHTA